MGGSKGVEEVSGRARKNRIEVGEGKREIREVRRIVRESRGEGTKGRETRSVDGRDQKKITQHG